MRSLVLPAVVVGAFIAGAGGRPVSAQNGVGFRLDLGYHDPGGEWGRALTGAPDAEAALLYGLNGVRFGLAANWGSLRVAGAEETWHHLAGSALLGYGRALAPGIRPFGEVRYVRRTARPEGARFFDEEAALQPISPFRARGTGVGARLGVEIAVSRRTSVSLFGEQQWFDNEPLPPEYGLGPISGGTSRRVGIGLTWFSGGAAGPERAPRGTDGGSTDGPDLGLAVGVGSLGLLVPWTWNEYVKGKSFTPVSPRSWWRGITRGFAWDDNDFEVNYWKHPYHGQLYYNAARANGYGFVGSAIQTLVGSYLWECCTETHIPSIPDMVTTVAGGITFGESLHRVSSRLVDGSARGGERLLREAATVLVDPSRGVSRLIDGRAWYVDPGHGGRGGPLPLTVRMGARGTSTSPRGTWTVRPAVDVEWREGDLFGPERGLFAYHRLRIGIHGGDRAALGRTRIRGALWRGAVHRALGGPGRVAAYMDLDYVDTEAYRWGAQAVSLAWAGSRSVADRVDLTVEATASSILMGSVDSEYARFAEIRGVRERLREYDFGIGAGAGLSVSLAGEGSRLEGSYRLVTLETLNGSNVDGHRSHHVLHVIDSSLDRSLTGELGVHLGLEIFVQRSYYGFVDFTDSVARRWEARAQLRWHPGEG